MVKEWRLVVVELAFQEGGLLMGKEETRTRQVLGTLGSAKENLIPILASPQQKINHAPALINLAVRVLTHSLGCMLCHSNCTGSNLTGVAVKFRDGITDFYPVAALHIDRLASYCKAPAHLRRVAGQSEIACILAASATAEATCGQYIIG